MPKVGENNEPLQSRSLYGYDGSIWRPIKIDANGYVQVALPFIENVTARSHGYIGGAWQKNPLAFGFSDVVNIAITDASLASGYNLLQSGTVPDGEIWVITNILCVYAGTPPTAITAKILQGATPVELYQEVGITSAQGYDKQGWWIMNEGDKMQYEIAGATLGDTGYLRALGFSIDIDL